MKRKRKERGSGQSVVQEYFCGIMEATQNLLSEWKNLQINPSVRCPTCAKNKEQKVPIFTLESIENSFLEGKHTILCSSCNHEHFLSNIVPDLQMVYFKGSKVSFSELELLEEIGSGGFATVYKGVFEGNTVAIKKLTTTTTDSQFRAAFNEFRREIFAMSQLSEFQTCIQLYAICLEPFCLVLEFIPFGNLHSVLHSQPDKELNWEMKIKIALDIAMALESMHSRIPAILHLDLKSPNILMASLEPNAPIMAKVTDFGLSSTGQTQYARLVDNPVWCAPEILVGRPYHKDVDTYSFGVILFEILTRVEFFGEITFLSELAAKVINGERPDLPTELAAKVINGERHDLTTECLPDYRSLLISCWAQKSEARPEFNIIVIELKALLEQIPTYADIAKLIICLQKSIHHFQDQISLHNIDSGFHKGLLTAKGFLDEVETNAESFFRTPEILEIRSRSDQLLQQEDNNLFNSDKILSHFEISKENKSKDELLIIGRPRNVEKKRKKNREKNLTSELDLNEIVVGILSLLQRKNLTKKSSKRFAEGTVNELTWMIDRIQPKNSTKERKIRKESKVLEFSKPPKKLISKIKGSNESLPLKTIELKQTCQDNIRDRSESSARRRPVKKPKPPVLTNLNLSHSLTSSESLAQIKEDSCETPPSSDPSTPENPGTPETPGTPSNRKKDTMSTPRRSIVSPRTSVSIRSLSNPRQEPSPKAISLSPSTEEITGSDPLPPKRRPSKISRLSGGPPVLEEPILISKEDLKESWKSLPAGKRFFTQQEVLQFVLNAKANLAEIIQLLSESKNNEREDPITTFKSLLAVTHKFRSTINILAAINPGSDHNKARFSIFYDFVDDFITFIVQYVQASVAGDLNKADTVYIILVGFLKKTISSLNELRFESSDDLFKTNAPVIV